MTALDQGRIRPQRPPHSPLFDDVDQDGVRADLKIFFGPNALLYLDTYEKMRTAIHANKFRPRTWCWPAFFCGFAWFFYRKMYGLGALVFFLPIFIAYLFGRGSIVASAVFASSAKTHYVNLALERIAKADQLGLWGADREDYLRRAGGVSLTGGLLAGCVYATVFVLVFAAAVARRHIGH